MNEIKKTHNCGELNVEHINSEVILMGWVDNRRDHGGLIFIDLRDREGIIQIVFNPQHDELTHAQAHQLRYEYVISIKGVVSLRPVGTANHHLPTGEIEVIAYELKVLNPSKPLPFVIDDLTDASEEIRLRFRYLDLRRPSLKRNIILRHEIAFATRRFLTDKGFIEIETPMLIKSTPEGARDFLIPSRLNPGKFYALPQSPQLFKQLLMVAGFEKYFQIVRCFRDEDLRADRQPEFTQIDIEASFIDEEDIFKLIEGLMQTIFIDLLKINIPKKFPRLSYDEAMNRYGTDAPDLRFGMELEDISDIVKDSQFAVFRDQIADGGQVKGLRMVGGGRLSRGEIDELTAFVGNYGAKGLAYFKVRDNILESPITKFFTESKLNAIMERISGQTGDLLLFVADKPKIVALSLTNLRLHLGKKLNMIPQDSFQFSWIVDPPLFEYDEEERRWAAIHHPFTSPKETDYPLLKSNPGEVKARAYDLVLNGIEIGGGSIRIHRNNIQKWVFTLLGISDDEAKKRFGFLLEALEYGAPPHGGIALGLDRLLKLIVGASSIRDIIAFPKTQSAACLLTDAPFEVHPLQLKELHIKTEGIVA